MLFWPLPGENSIENPIYCGGWTTSLFQAYLASYLSQLVVAAVGGNAFAGERVDRSAEFLASLPISRQRILTSKLLFALIVVGAIWLIDGTGLLWFANHSSYKLHGPNPQETLQILGWTAIIGAVFFSVAWLLSSFLTSPTLSVCGGLLTPIITLSGLLLIAYLFDLDPDDFITPWYRWSCIGIAPVCFALGTWLYLRRVEP